MPTEAKLIEGNSEWTVCTIVWRYIVLDWDFVGMSVCLGVNFEHRARNIRLVGVPEAVNAKPWTPVI